MTLSFIKISSSLIRKSESILAKYLFEIDFKILEDECSIECYVLTKSNGATGLEMEALTALTISLLTIYDMCKGIDKGMTIKNISLMKKMGGKSGEWINDELITSNLFFILILQFLYIHL